MKNLLTMAFAILSLGLFFTSSTLYSGGGKPEKSQAEKDRDARIRNNDSRVYSNVWSRRAKRAPGTRRVTTHGRSEGTLSVSDRNGAANYRVSIKTVSGFRGMQPNLGLKYSTSNSSTQYGVGWGLSGIPSLARCGTNTKVDPSEKIRQAYSCRKGRYVNYRCTKYRRVLRGRWQRGHCTYRSWGVCYRYHYYYQRYWANQAYSANCRRHEYYTATCHRDVWQKVVNKAVAYNNTDRLCYQGQKLILKHGTQNRGGSEYRSTSDRWIKAKLLGKKRGWDRHCSLATIGGMYNCKVEVTAKNGTVTTFLPTGDKRQFFPTNIKDLTGNEQRLHWVDLGNRETVIRRIEYTANSKVGRNPSRQVYFHWEQRPDKTYKYAGGYRHNMHHRLHSIHLQYKNGGRYNTHNIYNLKYSIGNTTKRSLLASVQMCDGANRDCIKPTSFQYTDGRKDIPPLWQASQKWLHYSGSNSPKGHPLSIRLVGDTNGDGLQDLAYVQNPKHGNDRVCTALSNGRNGFSSPRCASAHMQTTKDNDPYLMGDTNGDGKADFIYFSDQARDLNQHGARTNRAHGNGFHGSSRWSKPQQFIYSNNVYRWARSNDRNRKNQRLVANYHSRQIVDVNNDGRMDMVLFDKHHVKVALADTRGNLGYLQTWYTKGFTKEKGGWQGDKYPRLLGDVNGDGLPDIVGFGNSGVHVALNNGRGFNDAQTWAGDMVYGAGWRTDQHPRHLADWNGDGLMDLVGFGGSGTVVFLSTGTGFTRIFNQTDNRRFGAGNWEISEEPRIVQDVNGDGMADIIGFQANGQIVVALSTGSGMAASRVWRNNKEFTKASGWTGENHPRFLSDVNGDGLPDLVAYGTNGAYVVKNTGGDSAMGVGPDNLKKITDGFRDSIWIGYATIPHGSKGLYRKGWYKQGGQKRYPEFRDRSISTPIVYRTHIDNGVTGGKPVITDYRYENFTMNKNGLGAEGFEKVTAINVETNSQVIKEYYLMHPRTNMPKKRVLLSGTGTVLSSESFQYTDLPGGSFERKLFEIRNQSVRTINGGYMRWGRHYGGTWTNTRITQYDGNGLPYLIKDLAGRGGDKNVYRCRRHRLNTNLWIIDFAIEERTMKRDPRSYSGCRFGQPFKRGTDLTLSRTSEWYALPRIQYHWDDSNNRFTREDFHYDSGGAMTRKIDANGNSTFYGFDRGRDSHMYNIRAQNALGHVVHKHYHWNGQIRWKTFSSGRRHHFEYDNFGRLRKAFGVNPVSGQPTLVREIRYRDGGRQGRLKVESFMRKSWSGDRTRVDTNEHTAKFNHEFFDTFGNKVREEKNLMDSGKTQVSETRYDSTGQITVDYQPYFKGQRPGKYSRTTYYRGSPRIKTIVAPTGHVTNIRWSSDGLQSWQTVKSPTGSGTTTAYMKKSIKGNTIMKDLKGVRTYFYYDELGHTVGVCDARNICSNVWYNSLGQATAQRRKSTGHELFKYDANGNLIYKRHVGSGQTTTFKYDKLGRIVRSTNGRGNQDYWYDNGGKDTIGRVTAISYPGGGLSENFGYDAAGEKRWARVEVDAKQFMERMSYTPAGELQKLVFPNGDIQHSVFQRGFVKEVTLNGRLIARADAVNVGAAATEMTMGNGDKVHSTFNSYMQLTRIRATGRGKTHFDEVLHYNNSTGKVSRVDRGDLGISGYYRYDAWGRLINAQYKKGSAVINNENYTFDKTYNLTSVNDRKYHLTNHQVTSAQDSKGSMSFKYDSAGRMYEKTKSNGFRQTFKYDPTSNKVLKITTGKNVTEFIYAGDGRQLLRKDSSGRRIVTPFPNFEITRHKGGNTTHTVRVTGYGKTLAAITENGAPALAEKKIIYTNYKLSAGMIDTSTLMGAIGYVKNRVGQLLSRPDLANELLKGLSLVFSLGVLFAMIFGIVRTRLRGKVHWWHYPILVVFFTVSLTVPVFAGTNPGANGAGQPETGTLYFYTDHLGSTGATSDASGNNKSKMLYNSYGMIIHEHSTGRDNFRPKFLGKEFDAETKLTYMGARVFDPDIRRFTTPDPAHQKMSPYRYAADPIKNADPTGNFIFTLIAIIVGALITGFVLAGSIAGTFNPAKWDAKVWGYFFAGAIVGALFGAVAAFAAPAAIASAAVASSSWAAFGITAAITFGVGIAQAMVIGAIKQGGLIDTGKQSSFDVNAWGMDVLNDGVIGGAIGVGAGALFKGAGQGFAALGKKISKVTASGNAGWLGKATSFISKHKSSFNKMAAFTGKMSPKDAKAAANLAAFNKMAAGEGFTAAIKSTRTLVRLSMAGNITRAVYSVVGAGTKMACWATSGCAENFGAVIGLVGSGLSGDASGFAQQVTESSVGGAIGCVGTTSGSAGCDLHDPNAVQSW